ncbi:MAG: hypothetical protein SYNGOMJ08_00713 [Candidatus Syntrophoarchaeum sp. GoM_oil]|nr:MAG: hypothetical protein SYNGOMJ08_00713 [Candidatus Syntrophoarchaeum sp. GoM_oil]
MAKKEPKTVRGQERKLMTGDGRKRTPVEKAMKEMNKNVEEIFFGKKKRQRKKK